MPLDGRDGPVRIGDGLTLCNLAHHSLIILKRNHGRSSSAALGVGDDDGLAALQHRDTGIGCTKVDADNLTHNLFPPIGAQCAYLKFDFWFCFY